MEFEFPIQKMTFPKKSFAFTNAISHEDIKGTRHPESNFGETES